ncbi:MAG: hypothetical protein WB565_16550 [Acidimicrobiales bacterium]
MTSASWLLVAATGAMALFQWRAAHIVRSRDSQAFAAAHFRFAACAYGVTAVLALISAIASSSIAFDLAIIGLVIAAGSGTAFRVRHWRTARRAKRSETDESHSPG